MDLTDTIASMHRDGMPVGTIMSRLCMRREVIEYHLSMAGLIEEGPGLDVVVSRLASDGIPVVQIASILGVAAGEVLDALKGSMPNRHLRRGAVLTGRQTVILNIVWDCIRRDGVAPTASAVALLMRSSNKQVAEEMEEMVSAGVLSRTPRSNRGQVYVIADRSFLHGERRKLLVRGSVSSGGLFWEPPGARMTRLDADLGGLDPFALRVEGSDVDPDRGVRRGDLLLLDEPNDVRSGRPILVQSEGRAGVATVQMRGGAVTLVMSGDGGTMDPDSTEIVGSCMGVVRSFGPVLVTSPVLLNPSEVLYDH